MKQPYEKIEKARQVDLFYFLLKNFPETVNRCGNSRLKNKEHNSLVITEGKGWIWNSQNEKGNSIDYLVQFLNYTFFDAVEALCAFSDYSPIETPAYTPNTQIEAFKGNFKRSYAYLIQTRGLSAELVAFLFKRGYILEDDRHNVVFVSKACNYAEINGTLSYKRFKGIKANSDPDGFFIFSLSESFSDIYICESAIDALSLYEIIKDKNAAYVSIGGLKPGTVKRIEKDFPKKKIIIAVDNDSAGNEFYFNIKKYDRIIPKKKDWNEVLIDL